MAVEIRAKSVLKLDTGQTQLDYEYDKGTSVDEVAKHMIHAVVFNKGLSEARQFVDEFLSTYENK